ncbi:MAG: hypothetical protein R3355_06005 [Pseudomonas sp.]|uniref:hypothetical protein n=1 Tax=Pseudomonas sp. TaxID=306 RepID=UPI00299E9765|nr:hypothetical protein [Pseudomonas sp.]MDX1722654.1 hypothetical protein [Pseudomonas sp.]
MSRYPKALLFSALLAAVAPSNANSEPGLAEYQAAIEARDNIASLIEQISDNTLEEINNLPANSKEDARALLLEYAPKLIEQLKASADLGFPPAQFLFAQTLKDRAPLAGENREANKEKACALLDKAAASGLLAAAVGKNSYCSTLNMGKDITALIQEMEDSRKQLAAILTRPDPYEAYYPLKAFTAIDCFERDIALNDMEALTGLSPVQRMQAVAPLLMSFQETQAQAYFMLAPHESKELARKYFAQAEALGCSSEGFFAMKKNIDKAKTK